MPDRAGSNGLVWSVRNISVTGAFLETSGPISVGDELDLTLVFGAAMIHVTVQVVRIQEPAWGKPGGVGVAFRRYGSGAREFLESYIAATENGEHT